METNGGHQIKEKKLKEAQVRKVNIYLGFNIGEQKNRNGRPAPAEV